MKAPDAWVLQTVAMILLDTMQKRRKNTAGSNVVTYQTTYAPAEHANASINCSKYLVQYSKSVK